MKIKRLIAVNIPVKTCNLDCDYCYLANEDKKQGFKKPEHSPEEIRQALSNERCGGCCIINLTGAGETLLYPDIKDIMQGLLLEGHYLEVVTNATCTQQMQDILRLPPHLLERVEFKSSFHYLELKKRGLLTQFSQNIHAAKEHGASYTVEMVASDGQEEFIDEIQKFCREEFGALCHLTIERDDAKKARSLKSRHSKEEYMKIWKDFSSEMFDFKMKVLDEKRKEFCYAGAWSAYIQLETGDLRQCYGVKPIYNIFENTKERIPFRAIGYQCCQPYCFNAHAFLAMGDIPDMPMRVPSYAEIRNRVCADGTEWLNSACKEAFSCKLYENNRSYGPIRKYLHKASK